MTADRDIKFANTVLFVLRWCSQRTPGVTALMKLLFLADYEHYRRHLRQITQEKYVALTNGPVPNNYRERLELLVANDYVRPSQTHVLGHDEPKQEYVPKVDPDESVFTETELDVLRDTIRQHGWKTAKELIDLTHNVGPWQFVYAAEDQGRPIPPTAFRWLDNLPDEEDLSVARAILANPGVAETVKELQK